MNKAIFLDRDGVINKLVFYPKINEYAAPLLPQDLQLLPNAIKPLKELLDLSYKLFLISNQPDFAKGRTSLENIKAVHEKLHKIFEKNKINFTEYYYCYHHPDGTIPEYTKKCECRKPGNLFLQDAKAKYNLDISKSWIIGDRDSDIYCGQSLEFKTIMIIQKESTSKAGQSKPDYKVRSLKEAVEIIGRLKGLSKMS